MVDVKLQAIIVPLALILLGVFFAFFKQANIIPVRFQRLATWIGWASITAGCALELLVWSLANFMNLSVWWALR